MQTTALFDGPPSPLARIILLTACAARDWDRPALTRDCLAAIEPVDLHEFPPPYDPFSATAVCVSDSFIFIICESTIRPQQWVGNVLGAFQANSFMVGGKTHAYFEASALLVYQTIRDLVVEKAPNRKIVAAGHSLGGAIAQMVGYRLARDTSRPLLVVCSGSPRVGNEDYASRWNDGELFQLAYRDDVVPCIPPPIWGPGSLQPYPPFVGPVATYAHAGDVRLLKTDGQIDTPAPVLALGDVFDTIAFGSPEVFHAHETYVRCLQRAFNQAPVTKAASGLANPAALDAALQAQFSSGPIRWAPEPDASGPGETSTEIDMPATPPPILKVSWVFGEDPDRAGWTESLYCKDASSLGALMSRAEYLAGERAKFLSEKAQIDEIRIVDVENPRIALRRKYDPVVFAGKVEGDASKLGLGIGTQLFSNGIYLRTMATRGFANADIKGDRKLNLSGGTADEMQKFYQKLCGNEGKYKNTKLCVQQRVVSTNVAIDDVTIGVPVKIKPHSDLATLKAAKKLAIRGLKGCKSLNGIRKPSTTSAGDTITLVGSFPSGLWVEGTGTIGVLSYVYTEITSFNIFREVVRKTGRPSDQRVGRRSNRF